ncbi:DUF7168 domain-containing protein [Marinomonas fungiae]|uniref:Uncharacterized protein n=1 Tax=Marinomonas fungiae TaxID=1137284 RepID=A0A0K6IUF3_9GAMM|nr:DUF2786 domain-containing protein [Marinomonas fungiae]CUB06741.1 Protein of unknown function (DUF2786) [Marinomonas fungiae]
MSDERILDKIKKSMALANSSDGNEVATALRQAQALMKKHGIGCDEVKLSNVETVKAKAGKSQNPPRYHQMLVQLISTAFAVKPIYHSGFDGADIEFIGFDSQPEIAAYCYEVLYRQLLNDRSFYQKTLSRFKHANKIRKADLFAESWVYGVSTKVVKFALTEEQSDILNKYIVKRGDDLTKVAERKHKAKREDGSAIYLGGQAGRNADLFRGTGQDKRAALTHS